MTLRAETEITSPTTPIRLVTETELESLREGLAPAARAWLERQQFAAKPQQVAWLPGPDGAPAQVVVGAGEDKDLSTLGALPFTLPEGVYHLDSPADLLQLTGWGLGAYQFTRYRTAQREPAELLIPGGADAAELQNTVAAVRLTRDLINMPADDLGPTMLAREAVQVAETHGAESSVTVGEDLLAARYATIHAVGRAAEDAPRLIDFTWGDPTHPKVTLVGKGVCFDSGGLDIKPASGMRTMKKDMGGAACVLGLAQLIMSQALPVRLRVLIPAVENAISGNAYRPGDVITTYAGVTVEIDNTDAEGRLVLCDALALAAEEEPDVIFDYATLTGSARSAVGAEIAAMFCNDDTLADAVSGAGEATDDPVWRLPLHQPYREMLDSKVADTVNSASQPFAGAITAALFLERFVSGVPWVHFDVMAYNVRARPGRPEGGEAMAVRAVWHYLKGRYGG